jgi:hypothetical protein
MSSHVLSGRVTRCPICLSLIELDYAEALAMHVGALPNEYDGAALAREIEADKFHHEIAADLDFVTMPATRGCGPNDTQPYRPLAEELVVVDEPVGFEVVA